MLEKIIEWLNQDIPRWYFWDIRSGPVGGFIMGCVLILLYELLGA